MIKQSSWDMLANAITNDTKQAAWDQIMDDMDSIWDDKNKESGI